MKKISLTLVEVMISTIVTIILFMVLIMSFGQARTIFSFSDVSITLQAEERIAMNRIIAEVRMADSKDILSPQWFQIQITQDLPQAGTDTLVYHLPRDSSPEDGVPDLDSNGNMIWDPNSITLNLDPVKKQLIRDDGTTQIILLNNVKKINFIDYTIDAGLALDNLKIILELEKIDLGNRAVNKVTTAIVNLRN